MTGLDSNPRQDNAWRKKASRYVDEGKLKTLQMEILNYGRNTLREQLHVALDVCSVCIGQIINMVLQAFGHVFVFYNKLIYQNSKGDKR